MLLGFPRHALLLILDDAFVWNFVSPFITNCHFQMCESVCTTLVFLESVHLSVVFFGSPCRRLQWVAWLLSYATRNCLLHELSSRPSHSDFCPCVILLHVLLVRPIAALSCNWVKVPRLQITLGFPRHAWNVGILVSSSISECYTKSFRGVSCLANNFSSPFSLTTFTTHSSSVETGA